jgi:dihydrofolate reductase
VTGPGRVILLAAASLDLRIADAEGGVGWLAPFEAAGDHGLDAFMAGVARIAMGRRTYEQVRGFGAWPYAGKPVSVLTARPLPDPPEGVTAEQGAPAALAARWREAGDVWLNGGAEVFGAFLAADEVDRIEIFLAPALLSAGPMLLPAASRRTPRLAAVERFPSGLLRLAYAMNPLPLATEPGLAKSEGA